MSIPTGPITYFIVVQAGFALGLFETLLNGVASRGDPRQGRQADFWRRIGEKVGALMRLAPPASHQVPSVPSRQTVSILDNPLAGPVVDANALFAFGYLQTLPAALGPGSDQRWDRDRSHALIKDSSLGRFATYSPPSRDSDLRTLPPHAAMGAHRKQIPTAAICHSISQDRRFTVNRVFRHPAHPCSGR